MSKKPKQERSKIIENIEIIEQNYHQRLQEKADLERRLGQVNAELLRLEGAWGMLKNLEQSSQKEVKTEKDG